LVPRAVRDFRVKILDSYKSPWIKVGTMARPLRIEYDGAHYHITSRGNQRTAIFRDDTDREKFLLTKQFKPFQPFNR